MKYSWSKEKDDILRKLFPTTDTKELAISLKETAKRVSKRAWDLGLRKTKEFIRNIRSKNSTKDRKCKLCDKKHEAMGFCHNHYALYKRGTISLDGAGDFKTLTKWLPREIELLKKTYPIYTNLELQSLFKNRTLTAIKNKADDLGILKNTETLERCHKEKMTLESRIKNSCTHRGIELNKFEGFSTTFNIRIRQTEEYKLWRSKVFLRDNYTCQRCKKLSSGNLNAHHKKPLSQLIESYPNILSIDATKDSFFYDIKNGITLCEKCHSKVHKKMSLPKTKRNQRGASN